MQGEPLDLKPLSGISAYEPSELVVTVRAGTPLAELEAALAEKSQRLPFEPPRFGPSSTVGGMVAAGLAGPARAAVGGVRDYVLGATVVNGRGELLSFDVAFTRPPFAAEPAISGKRSMSTAIVVAFFFSISKTPRIIVMPVFSQFDVTSSYFTSKRPATLSA